MYFGHFVSLHKETQINMKTEYDQEILQSHTTDQLIAKWGWGKERQQSYDIMTSRRL